MAVAIKSEPVLIRPAGSHWLNLETGPRRNDEPFSNEELFPILELDVPRVGLVRAQFEANRYVHSSGWSEWRVYLKDVRLPDAERPELYHLGPDAPGVGPSTRDAIRAACEPLILGWLETDAYLASRQVAAAYAARREIHAPRCYRIDAARTTINLLAAHLTDDDLIRLRGALDLLDRADELLNPPEQA